MKMKYFVRRHITCTYDRQFLFTSILFGFQEADTHTHPFNGPLFGTTWVSQYQKGKTNLDISEARDSEWQWHQLGHMQVCHPMNSVKALKASADNAFLIDTLPY